MRSILVRTSTALGFCLAAGGVQASSVTCPNAPIDRYVTVSGALSGGTCYYQDGNLQAADISGLGLNQVEWDVVATAGSGTSGQLRWTQNGGGTAGTWALSGTPWAAYQNLFVAFHFGNGGGTPDSFVVQLDANATGGSWELGALQGRLNGLSNIYLLGSGTPTARVAEPGVLALVGLGLLGVAALRRGKR